MARRKNAELEAQMEAELGNDAFPPSPPVMCSPADFEILEKLNKDIRAAARTMGRRQVAELCNIYYDLQKLRISTGNQAKAKGENESPNQVPTWFSEQFTKLENDIKRMLNEYVNVYAIGRWTQCAPPDALVTVDGRRQVPISSLSDGDTVVSFNRKKQSLTRPQPVQVASRPYFGELIKVDCSDLATETTPNHRWVFRMRKHPDMGYVVYLMRQGDRFRVGRCKLFHHRGEDAGRLHLQRRMHVDQADASWILKLFSTEKEAAVYEEFVAASYGFTEWPFHPPTSNLLIQKAETDALFALLDATQQTRRATQCLEDHGRNINAPLFQRAPGGLRANGTRCIETHACNALPEIFEVPVPTPVYGKMSWLPIKDVTRREYAGNVYSLDVAGYHKYIQDGLVTCNSICGVGPVIAAGLITHIDITKAPTVGCIWSFAGLLDPKDVKWGKGQKRPFNATLRTLLAFKLGESLVKVQNRDSDVYGKLFADRKRFEWARNKVGYNRERCAQILADKNIGKDTDAYAWYSGQITPEALAQWEVLDAARRVTFVKTHAVAPGHGLPMLPPAHIHAMARRWAVKLFLAHYHHVAFVDYYEKDPPKPYIFEHQPPGSNHRHFIAPPNFPWQGGGKSLREMT